MTWAYFRIFSTTVSSVWLPTIFLHAVIFLGSLILQIYQMPPTTHCNTHSVAISLFLSAKFALLEVYLSCPVATLKHRPRIWAVWLSLAL